MESFNFQLISQFANELCVEAAASDFSQTWSRLREDLNLTNRNQMSRFLPNHFMADLVFLLEINKNPGRSAARRLPGSGRQAAGISFPTLDVKKVDLLSIKLFSIQENLNL